MELREIIRQHHGWLPMYPPQPLAPASVNGEDTDASTSMGHTGHSLADSQSTTEFSSSTSEPITNFKVDDAASIKIRASPSSHTRSTTPPYDEELKNSRPYKRLQYRALDPSSNSVFSKDSSATKGDNWSILSAMTLGDPGVSVMSSEISVLELPPYSSHLYDPVPYAHANCTKQKLSRPQSAQWPSPRGLHNEIFLKLLGGYSIVNKILSYGCTLIMYASMGQSVIICLFLLERSRGAAVDHVDKCSHTSLSYDTTSIASDARSGIFEICCTLRKEVQWLNKLAGSTHHCWGCCVAYS